jgi:6-phosphogluconate dehydrogenase
MREACGKSKASQSKGIEPRGVLLHLNCICSEIDATRPHRTRRMGGNMARRLIRGGHTVVGWDRSTEAVTTLASHGGVGADSVDDLVRRLDRPRAVWIMVPAARPLNRRSTPSRAARRRRCDHRRRQQLLQGRHPPRARAGREGLRLHGRGTSGGVWGASAATA